MSQAPKPGLPLRIGKPVSEGSKPLSGQLLVGLDVGSTTVKGVVVDPVRSELRWSGYLRHEMRPAAKLLSLLRDVESEAGIVPGGCEIYITGSGSGSVAEKIGARYVQEVNAVAAAIEWLHPEVNSVIELGGQDAKIILFREPGPDGGRQKFLSMNDKCAGGTGVVIDKINAKLRIPAEELCQMPYRGVRLHPVAGKCGVFAETDINDLQKQGVPKQELIASLFEALVLQTLTVLARGHSLLPHVALLGGPNNFLRGLRDAWRHNIVELWKEREIELPACHNPEELIGTPSHALYFAALGAMLIGTKDADARASYIGRKKLAQYVEEISAGFASDAAEGTAALIADEAELQAFRARYSQPKFSPPPSRAGKLRGFIGLDAGSTSTKAVLISEQGEVLHKAYRLSLGNPIEDAIDVLGTIRKTVEHDGATLEVLGLGTTGYAKDLLRRVLHADLALVETVAHAESAKHFFHDPQIIVDVGGQDIKLIVLNEGRVKDFKLNTQCSAGNGYFLQSAAEGLSIEVSRYAELAFRARRMPVFGYGCAVFLQADIVNFQRQGWRAEEILAGLAAVLPKNVFLHVAKVPDLASLGHRFVLQGGAMKNLAVVKATVDFLRTTFSQRMVEPEIDLHPHCAEAGAIGVALEARRCWTPERPSSFIGVDSVEHVSFSTTRADETRCHYCKNSCVRTFLDVTLPKGNSDAVQSERVILASCEKGSAESVAEMREIKARLDACRNENPNLVEESAREIWKARHPELVCEEPKGRVWSASARRRAELYKKRGTIRVGIPRALGFYSYVPLFSGYLESLGVRPDNITYSSYSSDEMYRAGASRGSIDPCFPSKIALAHVHDLLFVQSEKKRIDVVFFPMLDVLPKQLPGVRASNACPTTSITPETIEAAFRKETDIFAERGIQYLHPLLNLDDHRMFARQMFEAWKLILGITVDENERAVNVGFRELQRFQSAMAQRSREVLAMLEAERRLGIVMLGRPYHHDPGINHGILEQLQACGYPILSQSTLPTEGEPLETLFGAEIRAGIIRHPLDIRDVWKTDFSGNSNLKLWAAKFTARHPNLVAVELSNFKCGHDAPIYGTVERIIQQSGTPFFSFKDIDENRPANTIKLRVETIDYFLKRNGRQIIELKQRRLQRAEQQNVVAQPNSMAWLS